MHRFTNEKGIELIKQFEGFKPEPYVCAGGYLTIGYGHKLLPSDSYKIITNIKAHQILENDLRKIERSVLKYIDAELNDDQFAALVSFTFNVGPAALQRSTIRQKINYDQYDEAAKEFLKWIYAGGKRIMGLVRRRKVESDLFNSYKIAISRHCERDRHCERSEAIQSNGTRDCFVACAPRNDDDVRHCEESVGRRSNLRSGLPRPFLWARNEGSKQLHLDYSII